jgi:hypothetical protein
VVDVDTITVNYLETRLKLPLNTLIKGLFYWQTGLVHIVDMDRVVYCPEEVTLYLLSEGITAQTEIENFSDEEQLKLRKRAETLATEKAQESEFDIKVGEDSFVLVGGHKA